MKINHLWISSLYKIQYIYLFSVLSKPSLSLNMTKTELSRSAIQHVAALSGAGAVVSYKPYVIKWSYYLKMKRKYYLSPRVSKIDSRGHLVQELYNCTADITGLLVLHEKIYIIHYNGTLLELSLEDGHLLQVYHVPVIKGGGIFHSGSLSVDPSMMPDQDQLLLTDKNKNEVFTYKLSTREKVSRIRKTRGQFISVSYLFYNKTVFYIVCGYLGDHTVSIYNSTWNLVRTVGSYGTSNGRFNQPHAAIVSPDNTIIVADYNNNRLSEFTITGVFVRQILDSSDGIIKPKALSFWSPYLWVVHSEGRLYRYNYY